MIGFLVVVPSNPEGNFFQLIDAIVNIMGMDEWKNDTTGGLL